MFILKEWYNNGIIYNIMVMVYDFDIIPNALTANK